MTNDPEATTEKPTSTKSAQGQEAANQNTRELYSSSSNSQRHSPMSRDLNISTRSQGGNDSAPGKSSSNGGPKRAENVRKLGEAITRSLVEPMQNSFGISADRGYCMISFRGCLDTVLERSTESPVQFPVYILLVLFDYAGQQRFELQGTVRMRFDLRSSGFEVSPVDQQVLAFRVSGDEPDPEHEQRAILDGLRQESFADSEVFIGFSIANGRYEFLGWITCATIRESLIPMQRPATA